MSIQRNSLLNTKNESFFLSVEGSGNAFCDSKWRASEATPPYSRIYYITDGGGTIKTEDGTCEMTSGNVYLIPTGLSFSHFCREKMHQLYFHVTLKNHDGVDALRGTGHVLSKKVDFEHTDKLLALYASNKAFDAEYLKSLLRADIFSILASCGTDIYNRRLSGLVKHALGYVSENLYASMTVRHVAEACAVSTATLTHKFTAEIGVSPGKYIDDMIMRKGEELLTGTELSLFEISEALGFYDQFYFSRKFKEKHGVSPLSYRKMYK